MSSKNARAESERPLRVLLVAGDAEGASTSDALTASRVAENLRQGLGERLRLVRASSVPPDGKRFDAAVLVPGRAGTPRIPDLPSVLVESGPCTQKRAELARLGVEQALPVACATCPREPVLVTTLLWAIERSRLRRELARLQRRRLESALHDALTGLPSLRLYRERLRQLLAQGRRTGKRLAVLFLDVDRFKQVNDDFGHEVGDRLLKELARRMAATVRETDTVARRGGDEFILLLDDIARPEHAGRVARDVLLALSSSTTIQDLVLRSSASIGIAVYPEDGTTCRSLERRADEAMYAAKRLGGGCFCFASGPSTAPVRWGRPKHGSARGSSHRTGTATV